MSDKKKPLSPALSQGAMEQRGGELLLYTTEDGQARIRGQLVDETVWLTQKQMADLFQKDVRTISEHLRNVFKERELEPDAVIRKFRITAEDGKSYVTQHYNLDVIISMGYRVKSLRGTQFRMWATQRLREYIVKGFTLDDERLKNPGKGRDYFDELQDRLRDIRSSERRFYQKITDIYATSIDYRPDVEITQQFFATVQNKLHWAIHGHTAAELIVQRADATRQNMGLTNWPGGRIRKADVAVAKNYLTEPELKLLNLIVEQYLAFAELQAQRRRAMHMQDWIDKLNGFLTLNERDILQDAGRVTAEAARLLAETEYEKFQVDTRRIEAETPSSDFDKFVEQHLPANKNKKDENE